MSTLGGLAAVLILSLSLFIKAGNVNSLKFRDHYRCHCFFGDKACDDLTGECEGACDREWFGPACQYKTCPFKGAPLWLTDDNDESDQSLKVKLATRLAFTWLRIVVRFPEKLQKLKIQFQQEDNSTGIIECEGERNATVNAWTLDIHCEISQVIKSIIFSGEAAGSLCSLYVSKGRNMAQIKRTSVWPHQWLYNGNEMNIEKPGGQHDVRIRQCFHAPDGAYPIWFLQFHNLIHVYEVLIVNTLECCGNRLKGFHLEISDEKHQLVFHYIDKEQHALPVYTIVPDPRRRETINAIRILFPSGNSQGLCEVQVFGDIVCPKGMFGRDCEFACHCAVDGEACFVSTGGCPSGCKPGYTGEDCLQACEGGQCTGNVTAVCSPKCISPEKGCRPDDGACIGGCQPGFLPPFCFEECATGTYGLNCSQACSTNCSAQLCNPITGECQLCVPRKKGKFCESECLECTDKCNPECEYGFCNHSNGTCELCQPGMYGQDCDQDCPASRWGPSCIHQCSRDCFSLSCRPKTGECSYCAEGIDKNYCDLECEDGQYGIGCKKTCSTYCFYGSKTCSHVDGECTKGCVAGFSPPLCVDECPNRTYGINCSQACSYNCFRQECDKKTGACIKCPPGRVGKQCEPGCQSGYFGDQCKQACSPNCFNSTCHDETGYCNLCPPGKTGDYCDIDNVFKSPTILSPSKESSGTWGTGSTIALVEAFVIAAFIISIIVIFIKRKTNFQFSNSTVKMSLLSTEENL